jgi:putative transposase
MSSIPDDLLTFLGDHRDVREYRRALAVKLALQGYLYQAISDMLDVTPGFISQWKNAYETLGTDGLLLKYKVSRPFLSAYQRQEVIHWLKAQQEWSVEHLRTHIETTYQVVFQSRQSYYQLLADAGITYKQSQRTNPKRDEERIVAKKKKLSLS